MPCICDVKRVRSFIKSCNHVIFENIFDALIRWCEESIEQYCSFNSFKYLNGVNFRLRVLEDNIIAISIYRNNGQKVAMTISNFFGEELKTAMVSQAIRRRLDRRCS